jgi:hypothetical protein
MTASMREWPQVLWFSATLLLLAIAIHVFGQTLGGQRARRLATIAGAGVGLSIVANILEDGLRLDAAFLLFVLGTIILDVALLLLSIEILQRTTNRARLLAIVPAATLAGILFFVGPGGPIILGAWLFAAVASARTEWVRAAT